MKIKKITALIISAVMLLTASSCGKDNKKNNDNNVSSDNTVVKPFDDNGDDIENVVSFDDSVDDTQYTTTTTALPTTTTTAAPQRNNKYKVESKKYTSKNGKAIIVYPQISGLYDEKMQEYYNQLFKSDITDYEKNLVEEENLDIKYKVTLKTKDILSIVIYGDVYYEGAAHPYSYAYAYNIDLETGSTFVPSAGVNKELAAQSLINGGKFNVVYSGIDAAKSDVIEAFADSDLDSLINQLTEKDVITVKKNKKGEYVKSGMFGCHSYLDANSDPVLIIETYHAMGDYIEIEFNF